jgi:hypothetical protein
LVAECVGQGRLDVADRQTAHERGDHQRFQGIGLGDVLAEQPGGELGVVPRSFGRSSVTGPAMVFTVTAR